MPAVVTVLPERTAYQVRCLSSACRAVTLQGSLLLAAGVETVRHDCAPLGLGLCLCPPRYQWWPARPHVACEYPSGEHLRAVTSDSQ